MSHRYAFVGAVAVGFLVAHAAADEADKPKALPPQLPKCIQVKPEARYVVGYDHLVHVTNSCSSTARCEVSTDVSPTPQKVTVAPNKTETVLTFRGSPARVFVPHVTCILDKP